MTRIKTPTNTIPRRELRWRSRNGFRNIAPLAAALFLTAAASCSPPDSHTPNRQPSAPTPGAATRSYEEWLATKWQGDGDPPTPLPVIREVTNVEYLKVHDECMATYGWIDEDEDPELFSYSVAEGQEHDFHVANYQCAAQYPEMPKYYQPYNRTQLEFLHTHLSGPVAECIRGLGHDVPEAPSKEKFISDWENDVSPRWIPWQQVPDDAARNVEKQCDYYPEEFYELATVPG